MKIKINNIKNKFHLVFTC